MASVRVALGLHLTLVAVFFSLFALATNNKNNKNVCVTQECWRLSKKIRSEMDPTADPCQDMFRYSCGGWLDKLNVTEDSFTRINEMSEEITRLTKQFLEEHGTTLNGTPSEVVSKLKRLYNNCMDAQIDKEKLTPGFAKLINRLGSWTVIQCGDIEPWERTDWDFQSSLTAMHNIYMTSFWGFRCIPRDSIWQEFFCVINPKGLTLKDYTSADSLHKYLDVVYNITELLGGNREIIEDKMKHVFEFEHQLHKISSGSKNCTYKYKTQAEFQLVLEDLIDWSNYLQVIYGKKMASVNVTVLSTNFGYFEQLFPLIRRTDKEILANYMMWTLVKWVYQQLLLPKEDNYLLKKNNIKEIDWRVCEVVVQHFFRFATSALFVERHVTRRSIEKARSLVAEIKNQFLINLNSVDWLDEDSRVAAGRKAQDMTHFIGYPDWIMDAVRLHEKYKDFKIERGDYVDNFIELHVHMFKNGVTQTDNAKKKNVWPDFFPPDETNAAYFNEENELYIFLGCLRASPDTLPRSYYYGRLGSLGGHEFIHGFDTNVDGFDAANGLVDGWMTNSTYLKFMNKSSCFEEFYSNYEAHGVKANGANTLAEDVSDSGGLKLAYMAFKAAEKVDDATLPGLNLTSDQLFFLGFSQANCEYHTPERLKVLLRSSGHSVGPFRLRGTISNNKEFAKAFDCEPNTPMNPVNKCELW